MDHEIEVEVFRAGDYGPRGAYDAAALDRIASDYSSELHEAPVTTDHRQEGPALGWVRGLRRAGEVLVARLGGMSDELIASLRSGEFKKRSIELYRAFEGTGRPYLRALTFLGAAAPVVKGLADPVFSESDGAVCVEFKEIAESEEDDSREECESADEAEESTPPTPSPTADPALGEIEESTPSISSTPSTPPGFAEPDAEIETFCREMREKGRVLPVWEERGLARFMTALDDATPVRFTQREEAPETTARAWFREFLESLPALVPMGEVAPAGDDPLLREHARPATLPENWRGVRVDEGSIALHQRVVRYCRSHPEIAYAEALSALDGRH
ncbi:hypothetical protein JW916_07485 [Candidatus Sumerlaeota bacterium]|nr:hypothetical protein [Candidatus Sumerlaeota bacterium]